jgi:hypothetical protein
MVADTVFVAGDIDGASLSFRQGLKFVHEAIGRLAEGLTFLELSRAVFAQESKISIAGNIFGSA